MPPEIIDWIKIILLLLTLIAILISLVFWSLKNGISPMPTSTKAKTCMLSMLSSEPQTKIYELGSGWGTLLVPLAKKYPHSQIIGFETSPIPYWFSLVLLKIKRCSNAKVLKKDFFSADLSDASLVVCYLYPGAMERLKFKFDSELPSGASVISNTFAVPGWIAQKKIDIGDMYHNCIYLYRVVRKV